MDSNNPAPAGNQKQLTPKRKILIYGSIFLVTFVIVFAIGFFFLRKPANNEKLEVSDITMTVSYNEYLGYSVKIVGVAKNTSGRALSYAIIWERRLTTSAIWATATPGVLKLHCSVFPKSNQRHGNWPI